MYPVMLYCDGVPFTRSDGALAVYMTSFISMTPHLLFVLRKADLCSCGCKGWCSIYVCMRALAWSFESAACGRRPTARHDGSPWLPSDAGRQAAEGEQLPFRVACVFFKNDLMEMSSTLGFPACNSSEHPCPTCWCTDATCDRIAGLSPITFPWDLKTWGDYSRACDSCEIRVEVTEDNFRQLRARLQFDRRSSGARGRAMVTDYPPLRLRKGDRLEPSPGLERTSLFDTKAKPFVVTFWRRGEETVCRRRNPLFSTTTGITPDRVIVPDWLHALSLGEFQLWTSRCWNDMMDANIFQGSATTAEAKNTSSYCRCVLACGTGMQSSVLHGGRSWPCRTSVLV